MKEFKKQFIKIKKKYPNRSPDEINCGLGWQAALELVLGWLDYSSEHKEIEEKIYKELEK